MRTAFDVILSDGNREELFSDQFDSIGADTFGEACWNAMMASDGNRCTVVLVVNDRDVKSWDISEGDNPDFDTPDVEAA